MDKQHSPHKITVPEILARKTDSGAKVSDPISAITAYDFTMARLLDHAGVDVILVGDSLGSVVQGLDTTLPVTMDQMIYHCRCVSRAVSRALVVGDMPFMSYQTSLPVALESAGRFLKEGGVSAVKLEGGVAVAEIISRIVAFDIPVMGHIGLTPQSYHRMGGHRVQGKRSSSTATAGSRERILADARAVQEAGAFSVVIEGVPAELAAEITAELDIPTIGIGAGVECDGQILVSSDLLGMNPDFSPRFVKQYANLAETIISAATKYNEEVKGRQFPGSEHSVSLPKPVALKKLRDGGSR